MDSSLTFIVAPSAFSASPKADRTTVVFGGGWVGADIHDLQKEEDERREKVLSPTGMLPDPRWG